MPQTLVAPMGACRGSSPVLEVVWLTQVAEAVPQQSLLSGVDMPATAKLFQYIWCVFHRLRDSPVV